MSDQAASDKPVVLLRPAPQTTERIFTDDALRRLNERYTVVDGEADPSEEAIDACLPEVMAIIGQPDLPAERLERAPKLRGILNVEGNFFQNVDYDVAFARGINVVACMPVYAQAVAEFSLGLAIDLARGITREDRAFREGREAYVFNSTQDSILLRGAEMGILGYGNIGRKLLPLLDKGIHALVTDLHERGLDQDVAVVVWGEYGRTPKVNNKAGRDHWPQATFALVAGGGFKMGQVIGKSDAKASSPTADQVGNLELTATIMHSLIDIPKLRLLQDVPLELTQFIAAGGPIPQLL